MPKWTEEQTAAIYAVDQFESFSNPYTMEATFFWYTKFDQVSWDDGNRLKPGGLKNGLVLVSF